MIASRFAVAVHILTLIASFKDEKLTSVWMAESIGVNPVVVRTLMSKLRKAGLVQTRRGVAGAELTRPLGRVRLLDIYAAVNLRGELFSLHAHPSPKCPVGANIHASLGRHLDRAERALEQSLAGSTLEDVMKEVRRNSRRPK
jgi:DNA-binding IscR family transcriptional regulator